VTTDLDRISNLRQSVQKLAKAKACQAVAEALTAVKTDKPVSIVLTVSSEGEKYGVVLMENGTERYTWRA